MAYRRLITEVNDAIALIKVSKPESLNVLSNRVITELNGCSRKLDSDQEIKVVIITGEGESFIAEADIAKVSSLNTTESNSLAKKGTDTFLLIEKLSRPVIAAINGFVLDEGRELSLTYGIQITSKKALMGQPKVGLGITPGFGGTRRLARTIGPGKAKELIFRANNIRADEALEVSLIGKVVEPEELMDEAMKMAKGITSKSQLAIHYIRQAINNGLRADTDTRMDIERTNFALCFTTEDRGGGMEAFLEKRKPGFKGY